MTLKEKAKSLTKSEKEALGERIHELNVTLEEYTLYVLAHEDLSDDEIKMYYRMHLNQLGNVAANIY